MVPLQKSSSLAASRRTVASRITFFPGKKAPVTLKRRIMSIDIQILSIPGCEATLPTIELVNTVVRELNAKANLGTA